MPLFAIRYSLFASLILLLVCCTNAKAIPLFARKYNVSCFTCHTSPPMLNDFGRRFQANGFQLPSAPADITPQQDNAAFPLTLVALPVAAHEREVDNIYPTPAKVKTTIKELELELFSTASLGAHFSYFTEVEIGLEGNETAIGLGAFYLLYTDVLGNGSGNLNFRIGKMNLRLPFASTSFLSNTSPLFFKDQVFSKSDGGGGGGSESAGEEEEESGGGNIVSAEGAAFARNDLKFADAQFAISAFGMLPQLWDGLRWELAFSTGAANEIKLRDATAVFASLNQSLPIPNTSAQIGAFFYGGKQSIVTNGYLSYPRDNNLNRIGADLEFYDPWINRLHFYAQYILGKDDNADFWDLDRRVTGSSFGVDAILLPQKFYAFARYDKLTTKLANGTKPHGGGADASQIDAGLRYHLLPNVIVTGGVTIADSKRPRQIGIVYIDEDKTTTSFTIGILLGY